MPVTLNFKLKPVTENRITINVLNNYTVNALVDTGATKSGITNYFIEKYNLKSHGENDVVTWTGRQTLKLYTVDVTLPNMIEVKKLEVSEIYSEKECDFIIGMDILRLGDFAFFNVDGKLSFYFRIPSKPEPIIFKARKE